MKKKYSFWEMWELKFIADFADKLYLKFPSPIDSILSAIINALRIIFVAVFTICFPIAVIAGLIFLFERLYLTYGNQPWIAIIGFTVIFIGLNTINFFASYRSRRRKKWYFWLCLAITLFGYIYALTIFI